MSDFEIIAVNPNFDTRIDFSQRDTYQHRGIELSGNCTARIFYNIKEGITFSSGTYTQQFIDNCNLVTELSKMFESNTTGGLKNAIVEKLQASGYTVLKVYQD